MSRSKKPKSIPTKRRAKIMSLAAKLRKQLFPEGQPIDPEAALDRLYGLIPKFDWFVGDQYFEGMKDVIAFAKFDDGKHIYLSEALYQALAVPGTEKFKRAAFVICHEIAHVILHSRSKKRMARNKLGSPENYRTEELKELEANLFAGSLMVPTTTLDTNLSIHSVANHYRTSYAVATKCIAEAKFYQSYQKQEDD